MEFMLARRVYASANPAEIMKIPHQLLAAVFLGVASHLLVFIHGEWHLRAKSVLKLHLILCCLLVILESALYPLPQAIFLSSLSTGLYLLCLFTSITFYRLFLHGLRDYPGPVLARVSKLWHVARCLKSKNHLLLDRLHHQYGDFVRTGPDELTIFDPNILHTIYDGQQNPFNKPAWYDVLRPYTGLNMHRSKFVHKHRRRVWDQGFTTQALQSYESQMQVHLEQLEQNIAQHNGQPICFNEYVYWFTWDVMGHFAFAESFGMLKNKSWHHAIHLLRKGLCMVGPLSPAPWLIRLAMEIPLLSVSRDFLRMENWCARQMDNRIKKQEIVEPDVSSYLIGWSQKNDRISKDLDTLYGDSITLIAAGSDTVAHTLICVFYVLAKYPNHLEKLRGELESVDIGNSRVLQSLPHLDGVLKEVLRLFPAVPTGGLREAPSGGISIAGNWIPGGTTICAPRYTISRLESCFESASEFIPERWYSKPHMVKNKKAFAPFALGQYNCIGANFAYMEMRRVTALLVSKFEVAYARNEDRDRVVDDMLDQFTAAPGELELVFRKRSSS